MGKLTKGSQYGMSKRDEMTRFEKLGKIWSEVNRAMKDPLTEKQHDEFLEGFKEQYFKTYARLLKSGACNEELCRPDDYTLARIAIRQTAQQYRLFSEAAREMEKNLEHF